MELSYGCQEVQQFTTSKKFAVRVVRIVRAQERGSEAWWRGPQGRRAQAFRLEPRRRIASLVGRKKIIAPQEQQPELVVGPEARRAEIIVP